MTAEAQSQHACLTGGSATDDIAKAKGCWTKQKLPNG